MTRWLIAGWGRVGPAHGEALRRSSSAEVLGVVDPDGRARAQAEQLGFATFDDLEAALKRSRPDALSIALPHDLHEWATSVAASHGVHVLCEKPMARDLDECLTMIKMCARAEVELGCILNYRGYEQLRWVHRAIASGAFSVRTASIDVAIGRNAAAPAWQSDARRAGGGVVAIVGVHYLDLLCWWLGDPVEVVSAVQPMGVEDVAVGCVRFTDGRLATLTASSVLDQGQGIRIELTGDAGRIVVRGSTVIEAPACLGPVPAEPELGDVPSFGAGHLVCLAEASDAFAVGEPFPYSGAEGARAIAVLDAFYRSATSASWQPVLPVPANLFSR